MLRSLEGKPCIKATMGAEYIVIEAQVRGCDWLVDLHVAHVVI